MINKIFKISIITFILGCLAGFLYTNMSDDLKLFTPEVIEETPFPGDTSQVMGHSSSGKSGDNYQPTISAENSVRRKRTAVELLSVALNTRSKKILQEFEFTESGAIKIGKFLQAISGDLKLSPNGIVARNKEGDTTFAIDGTTGDATFKGEVQAADFVISDGDGIVSLSNFRNGTVTASSIQQITSVSYVDLDSMSLITPELTRSAVVLILFTVQNRIEPNTANKFDAAVNYILNIDGVNDESMFLTNYGEKDPGGTFQEDGVNWRTNTMHLMTPLDPGIHTIKVRWRLLNFTDTGKATSYRRTLSFSVLGS